MRLEVVVQACLRRGIEGSIRFRKSTEQHAVVRGLVLDPYKGRSAFENACAATELPGAVAGDVPVEAYARRNHHEGIGRLTDIVGSSVLECELVEIRVVDIFLLIGREIAA